MNKIYKDIIQNGDVMKYDISQHDNHFNSLIDDKLRYIENEASLPISRKEAELTKNTFLFVGSQANTFRGHEYVDMGLRSGLKWATCNVGASSPEEFGTPYAWGEVFDKSIFTPQSSVFYNFPPTRLTPIVSPTGFSGRYLMDVAMEKWHIEYYDKNSFDYDFNYAPTDLYGSTQYKVPDAFDGKHFDNQIMNTNTENGNYAIDSNLYYLYGPRIWRTPTLGEFSELLSSCTISMLPDGCITLTSNINRNTLIFPPTTPVYENVNVDTTPYIGCYYTSHESAMNVFSDQIAYARFPDTPADGDSSIELCGLGVALQDLRRSRYVFLEVPKYYGMYIRPVIQI